LSSSFLTYTGDLIAQFRELDPGAHREIIRFYEANKRSIPYLDTDDFIEIELSYTNALFEMGRYESFLICARYLLESLIYHNIKYVNGEDVYEKLLFRKAAAHYHLLELSVAEKVLWELLRINPENQSASYLLKRCLLKSETSFLRNARAFSIFLFLFSAIVIGMELLVIRPFFDHYAQPVEFGRISIFLFALMLLVVSDGWHRLTSFHYVNREVERLKSRKKTR
jgi:tetratricopeptide (TPR) repeat protein